MRGIEVQHVQPRPAGRDGHVQWGGRPPGADLVEITGGALLPAAMPFRAHTGVRAVTLAMQSRDLGPRPQRDHVMAVACGSHRHGHQVRQAAPVVCIAMSGMTSGERRQLDLPGVRGWPRIGGGRGSKQWVVCDMGAGVVDTDGP